MRKFVTVYPYFTLMVIDNLVYKLRVTNSVQYMLEGAAPLGASESLRELNSWIFKLVRSCLRLSPPCPLSFVLYFVLLYCHDSCVCLLLLFHPFCFRVRGILYGIHTSCMGSPFYAVHTKWSLAFKTAI